MAKWFGKIGFAETSETKPGVWEESVVSRDYFGDLTRMTRRLESSQNLNDNLNMSNELSILADPYAYNNFCNMRYAEINGSRWKITNVEVQYPRLILSLGGVYNGET